MLLTPEKLQLPVDSEKVLFEETLKHIEVGKNPPHLISIIGPNRSGTTACAEVFARLGVPNYLQPIKSIRRAVAEGEVPPEFVVGEESEVAVHKETLGSSEDSEFFNPVEALLAAGYPADKIHLITMMRDPRMTLTSWNRIYGEKVNTAGLIRAIQMTQQIAQYAQEQGIAVTHYVHEAIRDNDAENVAFALLQRTGLAESSTDAQALVDWTSGPRFGSEESTDVFYDQPPEIFVEGIKNSEAYQYAQGQAVSITPAQENALESSGVLAIYQDFKTRTVNELDIPIQ